MKKHQHVVPRAYLRGWADRDDHVAVLDRGATAPKRLSVSNSAVRSRFYNFADADGAETDVVENWLDKHIEAPVGVTLKALRAGADIDDVDKSAVINFTVAQLVRTPTVFAFMKHFDEHLGAVFTLMEAAREGGFDLLKLSDADRDRYLAIARDAWAAHRADSDARASKLRTMVRKLDEVSTLVTSWHWSVLTSSEPTLISGDSPVATLNPSGYHWSGLIPEGSSLWMPLSPTVLLVADPVKPLGRATSGLSPDLAVFVTSALARQADRALFNAPGLPWPAGLAFPVQKPTLPQPSVTWRKSTGPPTFPATYPPVASAAVEALLTELGAVGIVE
ncbi:DUF4238 domain-containing protein [Pimelobacter sp. 30-1]|uniref:DUF4238 domain-containing protein n=1 Tax=Pimelobacter sp. 30-1 TaxID=2004991 RepID=UPI001C058CC9|nr:DUF4238 domain-containing protein [Pimelobacter sp. 30-1]MBU2694990.1 hypothetical protein [Pimelobacter sp. 30-1]